MCCSHGCASSLLVLHLALTCSELRPAQDGRIKPKTSWRKEEPESKVLKANRPRFPSSPLAGPVTVSLFLPKRRSSPIAQYLNGKNSHGAATWWDYIQNHYVMKKFSPSTYRLSSSNYPKSLFIGRGVREEGVPGVHSQADTQSPIHLSWLPLSSLK